MKKILYFDDEKMLGNVFKGAFEKRGFSVQYYECVPENKEELINLVLAENPNILITDIIHPALDGFQMTEILKSDERTNNIPIIALTNLGRDEDVKRGIDLGMCDYIVTRNIELSEIVDRIKCILDKISK